MDRRNKALHAIDTSTQVGVEVGPLDRPLIPRGSGIVYYVDHADTSTLRSSYKDDPSISNEDIVDVDFVWGEERLNDLLASVAPVDFVVASHVIEHVPDIVGWLNEVSQTLKDGGVLSLVVPDKRFTFDYFRDVSKPAGVVEAYFRGARHPSPGQVFDHYSTVVFLEAEQAWSGKLGKPQRKFTDEIAWSMSEKAAAGEYVDVHCWVFTPGSFIEMLRDLVNLGLSDFSVQSYFATERNDNEFYVTLERLPRGASPEETLQLQLESLPVAEDLDRANGASSGLRSGVVKQHEVACLRNLIREQQRRIEELESSRWRVADLLRTVPRWFSSRLSK